MNFKKIIEYFDCTKYKRLYEIERAKREFFESQIDLLMSEYFTLDGVLSGESKIIKSKIPYQPDDDDNVVYDSKSDGVPAERLSVSDIIPEFTPIQNLKKAKEP